VRVIGDDEGRRLVRIVRRGAGSMVTWRRAQMVLLSAQGMDVPAIAKVAFTSEDRVRDVIRNFNADGIGSLYPRYKGGHPPKFTLRQRREIKKIAKSKPAEHDLPFSTWSLARLADFLVAEGVVEDISHEGLRALLRQEGVTFQRLKTWKASKDPRYAPSSVTTAPGQSRRARSARSALIAPPRSRSRSRSQANHPAAPAQAASRHNDRAIITSPTPPRRTESPHPASCSLTCMPMCARSDGS
jgi:transposase